MNHTHKNRKPLETTVVSPWLTQSPVSHHQMPKQSNAISGWHVVFLSIVCNMTQTWTFLSKWEPYLAISLLCHDMVGDCVTWPMTNPPPGLTKLFSLVSTIVKPHQAPWLHLHSYARRLNHLDAYVIVGGHHMNSVWTRIADTTGLNFHSGACLVTHQNNTSCHAKSWSVCSIYKQHMPDHRLC